MPWYYAGLDVKPVGPVSLEELQARRLSGVLSPETYVIEYTGQLSDPMVWRRYRELFPAIPPPPPTVASHLPPPVPPVPTPMAPLAAHPLFPSAAPPPTPSPVIFHPPGTPFPGSPRTTNSWCSWGFGLALVSVIFSIICVGVFLAGPAFFVCLVGLFQVEVHRGQKGRGLALSGLFLSGLVLFITALFLLWAIPAAINEREQTTTEQSTNDSQ